MAEIKTYSDVNEFINTFAHAEQKKKDSVELVNVMQEFTGYEAKMWSPSMIGFWSIQIS